MFQFCDAQTVPETKVLVVALDSSADLAVLSSRAHTTFANVTGGWLGVGNDSTYNHSDCFYTFPFPDRRERAQQSALARLGNELDAHRKRQQASHPDLTITGMYNVLEKLRSGETLNAKDKLIHEHGLVSVLKQLHDDLDAAVFDAYGWPHDLTDEQILERLVSLNAERAAEEKRGLIRWLRSEYQNPSGKSAVAQANLVGDEETPDAVEKRTTPVRSSWPKDVPAQLTAIRAICTNHPSGLSADAVCNEFKGARRAAVEQHLESLTSLGLLVRYDVAGDPHWHG